MNTIEERNREIICSIVENHFYLKNDSIKEFKKNIYGEKFIAPEFKEILGDDLRARKKIKINDFSEEDEAWKKLKKHKLFMDEVSPGFEDLVYNKFEYKKNTYKLNKIFKKIYLPEKEKFIEEINGNYCNLRLPVLKKNNETYYVYGDEKIKACEIDENTIEKVCEYILELRELYFNSSKKRKELEVVISLNFADWFLCSTGESWTSCLNLESDYEKCVWIGLPGLIVDPNMAMLYITNEEKKEYNGIITDKFICRCWMYSVIDEEDKNNKFFCGREYPVSFCCGSILENIFKNETFINSSSVEYFLGKPLKERELLFQIFTSSDGDSKITSDIYYDNIIKNKIINKKYLQYFVSSKGCGFKYFTVDGPEFLFEDLKSYSLENLIIENKELRNTTTYC
jgi:hypothetical protein